MSNFDERLKKGEEFEKEWYSTFKLKSKYQHVTDKIFWTQNDEEVLIEYKSTRNVEWKAWKEYETLNKMGRKIIFVYEDRKSLKHESNGKRADWFSNIENDGRKKGVGGSYNDFTTISGGSEYNDFYNDFIKWSGNGKIIREYENYESN